ncbi:MAG: DNA recombination protein RmuC [Saprospiraceae bacterium]|nr:DNA recombination protein RmuC [Saprospiraceae bacterium]
MESFDFLSFAIGVCLGLIALLLFWLQSYKSKEAGVNREADISAKNQMLEQMNAELRQELEKWQQRLELNQEELRKLNAEYSARSQSLLHQQESLENTLKELGSAKMEFQNLQKEHFEFKQKAAEYQSQNKHLLDKLQSQKLEFEELRKQSYFEFQNIANKILDEKTQKFTASNKENIDNLLKPLGENLETFKKKVEETYDKESKQRFSLEEKVKELVEMNQRLSQEANNLASALKGQSKKQGNWGEVILESILEKSGLVKDREYKIQVSVQNEDGRRFQPDIVVYLPESRAIVIDSKVSLVAYDRYSSSEIKEEQDAALKEHIGSIYRHIDELSDKRYDTVAGTLDFTMMFIPIEPAYLLAIQQDAELWAYAYAKRILLISPTNLIAALKLVADLWKREQQSKNALEIARQGEKLYDKIVGFLDTMEDVGKHINKTQDSYLKAIGQLKDGRGSVVKQAQTLKKLGILSQKEIPDTLIPFEDETES